MSDSLLQKRSTTCYYSSRKLHLLLTFIFGRPLSVSARQISQEGLQEGSGKLQVCQSDFSLGKAMEQISLVPSQDKQEIRLKEHRYLCQNTATEGTCHKINHCSGNLK